MCLTAAEISTFGYPYYGNANKMCLESTIAYEAHSGLTIYSEAIHDTNTVVKSWGFCVLV